jgi:hypothetical protein
MTIRTRLRLDTRRQQSTPDGQVAGIFQARRQSKKSSANEEAVMNCSSLMQFAAPMRIWRFRHMMPSCRQPAESDGSQWI